MKLFHDQSPQKYGTGLGSNLQPLYLQSDMYMQSDTLQTVLGGPATDICMYIKPCNRRHRVTLTSDKNEVYKNVIILYLHPSPSGISNTPA